MARTKITRADVICSDKFRKANHRRIDLIYKKHVEKKISDEEQKELDTLQEYVSGVVSNEYPFDWEELERLEKLVEKNHG